ncbi:MAG: hypothetical protein HYX74_02660 [Acidobacteria bacterium]|nr:hypothetical protein [Acidobacteriota bacterium]
MQIADLAWPAAAALLLVGNALTIFRWRWDARRFQSRIKDLQRHWSEEKQRCADLEAAIDSYYIPHWQDATERLGMAVICTCPPYPYRTTCLKHAPLVLKRQVETLREIEGKR